MFYWPKILCLCFTAALFAATSPVWAYEPEYADKAEKVRLRWKTNTINLALSNSLRQPASNIKANSDVAAAVQNSLNTWEAAANVKFVVVWTDKQSISAAETTGDNLSLITIAATPENALPFQAEASEMPGRTRLFYNPRGRITEADVVLNPYQQFSTDGSFGTYDLEAVLTHEIGHLLGLAHSSVMSATMYAQQGKNGTFSLPAFMPRTLSEDDRAGARSLYGVKSSDEKCCGTISGTLISSEGKPLSNWQVWAEDAANNRILASVRTNAAGSYQISGLPDQTYRLIAQPENRNFSAEVLGETLVQTGKVSLLNRKLTLRSVKFRPLFIGYNAQLLALAVPLSFERWQTIFLGGDDLLAKPSTTETLLSSPFLAVAATTLTKQDFDTTLPVYSFNLRVKAEALPGEYSLQLQKANGEVIYLLGCFSLETD